MAKLAEQYPRLYTVEEVAYRSQRGAKHIWQACGLYAEVN